jgi:hypothetical protein
MQRAHQADPQGGMCTDFAEPATDLCFVGSLIDTGQWSEPRATY